MADQIFDGDVAQVVQAETFNQTNIIHVHSPTGDARSEEERRNSLVHLLLRECTAAESKPHIEQISTALYGSSYFKNLSEDQLRKLIDIASILSAYRSDSLDRDLPIPEEQARTCPQCSRTTWKATQLCKHCGMDLQKFDRVNTSEKIAKRRFLVVASAVGIAVVSYLVGRWILPSKYSMLAYGVTFFALMFAVGGTKR